MAHLSLMNEEARKNPFENLPPYEKLVGNMDGLYSRRINIQHRLVYQVYENIEKIEIFSRFGIFTQYGRGILALFRLDNRQVAHKHP